MLLSYHQSSKILMRVQGLPCRTISMVPIAERMSYTLPSKTAGGASTLAQFSISTYTSPTMSSTAERPDRFCEPTTQVFQSRYRPSKGCVRPHGQIVCTERDAQHCGLVCPPSSHPRRMRFAGESELGGRSQHVSRQCRILS